MLNGGIYSAREDHTTADSMIRVDKRQRRYVLLVYAWLAVFSLSLFGLLHMLEGNTLVGQLELLGAFAALLTIGGLRATNNIELVRSCLLLIIIAMLM